MDSISRECLALGCRNIAELQLLGAEELQLRCSISFLICSYKRINPICNFFSLTDFHNVSVYLYPHIKNSLSCTSESQ